jgi:LPS O-antigen subunit length determinant protein (WzzB/FepE family)
MSYYSVSITQQNNMSHREQQIAQLRVRLNLSAQLKLKKFWDVKRLAVRTFIDHVNITRECFMETLESEYNKKKVLLANQEEKIQLKKLIREHIAVYDQEYEKGCREAIAKAEREVAEYGEKLWKETEQEVLYNQSGGAFDRLFDNLSAMHS